MWTTICDLDRSSSVPRVNVSASVRSVAPVLVGWAIPLVHYLAGSFEEVVTLVMLVLVTAMVVGVKGVISLLTLYTVYDESV